MRKMTLYSPPVPPKAPGKQEWLREMNMAWKTRRWHVFDALLRDHPEARYTTKGRWVL